ncbi:FAD/NAD P-binding domain-containing protein [Gloeophyllum trabeum ATCC 11539]|uniref:FAD/NAD P-binding domain-containing protein n=1 Tax=Gloeophyllum trabeum (strain ATCC 11539 / FP-39264 / Madison 617) TaxID=670483 RepID=S7Q587_GLOTA|nr:FAD/NAD P-binding domain-containing protein [Gloeophyllum trabeum ATCC 11539]EPQ55201.1 FAD/NAD P-binding domain-containing protein [Gloeophyllum trabeum ATCC 11539]
MREADLVIVGAGWSGLVMAKTYLDCHPSTKLMILDAHATLGGVWAQERLYPGLLTNNMLGTFEYSDFPMDETFGVKSGNHIPGEVVHNYLRQYAEKHDIYRQIQFRSKVTSVERRPDAGWTLTLHQGDNDHETECILARKLILAVGLTSQPFLPDFPGASEFDPPLLHCKDLSEREEDLIKASTNVVVLGGTKYAWDAVYAFASAGVRVDWVIRKSGHGPCWMSPPYVTPFKLWLEKLATTRCLTWFSPCIWGDSDGFGFVRRLLHNTRIGRWFVDKFWGLIDADVCSLNGYDKDPDLEKLKPRTSAFWVGNSYSILNYPTDFFDYIRNGTVKIHVEDITRLSSRTVHLSSGESIRTDALICSTGWQRRPIIKFLPEGISRELGLPHESDGTHARLIHEADEHILSRFPRLGRQPVINPIYRPLDSSTYDKPLEPYRLYRGMVPPAFFQERSIAFSGFVLSLSTSLIAQAQALWLTAYLDGSLSPGNQSSNESEVQWRFAEESILWQTVLHSQFGKWRYPAGYGKDHPDFIFDAIPYIDMLLRDLGLEHHKKSHWVAECFQPYTVQDYRGLVDEWRLKA